MSMPQTYIKKSRIRVCLPLGRKKKISHHFAPMQAGKKLKFCYFSHSIAKKYNFLVMSRKLLSLRGKFFWLEKFIFTLDKNIFLAGEIYFPNG
jgi:hypothetical protein